MNRFFTGLCLSTAIALRGATTIVAAQNATSPPAPAPSVGPEFHPVINQRANAAVTAREVRLADEGRSSRPCLVLFSSESKEALVGSSTNRMCLLNGRIFRVDLGIQGFQIAASKRIGADRLTEQKAIELAWQAFRGGPPDKAIDLAALLEQEQRLHLANPLFLQDVALRAENTNLVVNVVSFSGLKGTVILDQELHVLSMALTDSKK